MPERTARIGAVLEAVLDAVLEARSPRRERLLVALLGFVFTPEP